MGKPMLARVEDRDAGVLLVTLVDDAKVNVNESLVAQGLLRVSKTFRKSAAPLVAALREKEEAAKSSRAGMWRYGDIEEDDDFEFGVNRLKIQQQQAAAAPTTNAWGKK